MKKLISVTIAASLLVVPGQLLARDDQAQPIVVERTVTPQQWSEGVTMRLDRNLRVLSSIPGSDGVSGLIQIRFDVVDGEATNVQMMRWTGRESVDSAVRHAVTRLHDMGSFVGAGESQTVQANIILAPDERRLDQISDELARSERARMASGDPAERAVIALNMASRAG